MATALPYIAGGMIAGGIASRPKGISAPPPRSYLGEMQSALDAQAGIQNRLLGLEQQYTPQYQELQKQSLMGQMGVLGSLYGQAIPQAEGIQSQLMASQGRLYGNLGKQALGNYQAGLSPETMGLYNTMMQNAQTGLEAGYGLTPQQQQMAQQSARAAMSARGLSGSNQGVASEILNSYNLSQNRYQQNLSNAANAYGLGTQQTATAFNMYGAPLMNQMSAIDSSNLINAAGTGYGALGAKLFQPESQYNASLIGANIQNQMSTNLANYQAKSAFSNGLIGMGGMMLGSYLGNPALVGGKTPS